jgi:hypothetical protein
VHGLADLLDDDVADVERVPDGPALCVEEGEGRRVLAVADADDARFVDLLQGARERLDRRRRPRLGDCRTDRQQADEQRADQRPRTGGCANVHAVLRAPMQPARCVDQRPHAYFSSPVLPRNTRYENTV